MKRASKPSTARERIVSVRFGAGEIAMLCERAEAAGLDPSTYLRALALRPGADPAAIAAVAHRVAGAAQDVALATTELDRAVDALEDARSALYAALAG